MLTRMLPSFDFAKWSLIFFLFYTLFVAVIVELAIWTDSTIVSQIMNSSISTYLFYGALIIGSILGLIAVIERKNMIYAVIGFLLNAITLWGFLRGFFYFS